jgi:hypothetical protein
MKDRFNPFLLRRLKQIDDLIDEVYHEVTPCDYDEDKFYIYFREITNWVVENFVNNNNLEDDNIAIDLHHLIRERYFEEFLDYFENAQLSCDEYINESEDKDVKPSDLKTIEFIAEYIDGVSGEYLSRSIYKPCFVSVTVGRNKLYLVAIVTKIKYTMDKYESFLQKKLRNTFKGVDIIVMTIDDRYDDNDNNRKSCEEHFNRLSKLPNTITIEF